MRGCGLGLGLSNNGPYTLPNGTEPLILLDFKNGVYMANGATVAVGDLLTEDANYGSWNTNQIHAGVGLVGSNTSAPVFTGAALALVLDGSTTLTRLLGTNAGAALPFRYEMTDDFINYGTYYYSGLSFRLAGNTEISDNSHDVNEAAALSDGTHSSALTFAEAQISRSTDGATVIAINPADPWTPAPGAMGFSVPPGITVEQIGIYPAQPDADLPTLSAL